MSLFRTGLRSASLAPTPRFIAPRIAFSTTQKRSILPAGPQVIDGTVNDPVPVPPPNPTHGSYHWTFERLISIALVPLTIAPFAAGSLHPITDAVLGAALVLHSHIGFQSCIVDYIPKRKYPKSSNTAKWALNGATALVLYGLYEFETNDVGITEGVKRVWSA
ncbi:succinate dehydrogenase cytochrome b small subunit mitochondrial precursor [Trichophaea hybrida]|nr:succinate dehydrogenase cytochrome b small subunit mitochondrial precursor [Trichophaea hybrida]